ncbi:MAG: AAA family ATPase [Helicobacteraceae bacterium]|nr:AAA family ATPase [Candidatus Sulfurimonas ponti]MBL6973855.1 AAA family ATPase [Sulfurimonas sp.]
MITEILIKNVASYDSTGTKIDNLKKVNFFFGNNGSGKSTIAKYLYDVSLDNPSETNFPQCSQNGFNSSNHQVIVFNENFIESNFISRNTQYGIFSLNEKNEEIDEKIKIEQNILKKLESHIITLSGRKNNIAKDKENKYNELKKICFEKRKSTIKSFLKIKDTFPYKQQQNNYDQLLNISVANKPLPIITFETLISDYKKYYDTELVKIENSISFELNQSIIDIEEEFKIILQKVIIGNNDIDIAQMINTLQIKKWVEDGIKIVDKDKEIQTCPFCQKKTVDKDLLEKFELYFDETYKNDVAKIEELKDKYSRASDLFLLNILNLSKEYNEDNKLSNLYTKFKDYFDENIKTIDEKIKISNEKKELKSIVELKETIEEINEIIKDKNNNFDNLSTYQQVFEENIWLYLTNECKDDIQKFDNEEQYLRISTLIENKILNVKEKILDSKKKIEDWREQTISTKEAIDNINIILKNSGFQGFEIEEKELNDNNIFEYYLKRIDGQKEDVFKSLSEGEKNFIAFLYFYQLCLGTNNLEESEKKKIIVIDDPVSSLDSQVLFLVNSLIQQLIARKSNSSKAEKKELKNTFVAQVFVLTHNIYFYKEISLDNKRTCIDRTFFKINKVNNKSSIDIEVKPILNDYSLLWDALTKIKENTVINPNDKTHNISITNIMRRVLESYVNFTGLGASVWNAVKDSNPEDVINIIASSLISEIQDGSHKISPLDDIYFTRIVNEEPQKLFDVFELIFNEIGKEHYQIMMGIDTDE